MFNLLSIMGNPKPYSGFYVQDVSGSTNTVSIKKNNANAPTLTIETSADGKVWSTLGQTSTTALGIQVPANGRRYVRCNTTSWAVSVTDYNYFNTATGNFKVGGNIMNLLYGSSYTGEETAFPSGSTNTFFNLFGNNNHITDASDLVLPATTLTSNCYANMFLSNTSLTAAPELGATTLANGCYQNLFKGCVSLVQAPASLPALVLPSSCYYFMFDNCSLLVTTPVISATIAGYSSCSNMFGNCTSLTTVHDLSITSMDWGSCIAMFNNCSSLVQAPALVATTLSTRCYMDLFNGCTSLSNVICLAEDISADLCTYNWLSNVASTGTFTKSANMSGWGTGDSGIPSNWTVQDAQ